MSGNVSGGRRALRAVGVGLIALAALLLIFGAAAYAGWRSGQTQRQEAMREQTTSELARQMELAREDAAAGNAALALMRLDWIEQRDPAYPGLTALRVELTAAPANSPTPTPVLVPTPTPPPTPAATPAPTAELAILETLVDGADWERAISAITAFQVANPSFERDRTDRLLFDAYVGYGQALLVGEKVELGLSYLDRAAALGPLPREALDQILWAELYLNGIAFYGVDWAAAISYFGDLCLAAPFYQNACSRLRAARVAYGDQFAAAGDWCPAVPTYRDALDQEFTRAVAEKLDDARLACLEATPTPTVTPEGGDELPPADGTPEPPGA